MRLTLHLSCSKHSAWMDDSLKALDPRLSCLVLHLLLWARKDHVGKQLSKRQRTGQLHLVVRFHTLQKREESAFKSGRTAAPESPPPPNELIEIKPLSKSRSNPNFGKITKSELFTNVNYLPFFSQRKPINSLPFGVTEGAVLVFSLSRQHLSTGHLFPPRSFLRGSLWQRGFKEQATCPPPRVLQGESRVSRGPADRHVITQKSWVGLGCCAQWDMSTPAPALNSLWELKCIARQVAAPDSRQHWFSSRNPLGFLSTSNVSCRNTRGCAGSSS